MAIELRTVSSLNPCELQQSASTPFRLRRWLPIVLVAYFLGCAPGKRSSAGAVDFPQPVVESLPSLTRSETVFGWAFVTRLAGHLKTDKDGTVIVVPKTTLRLYEGKWREPCCKNLKQIGQLVTSDDGYFDFGDVPSGRYWVAVIWDGREQTAPVDVDSRHGIPVGAEDEGLMLGPYSFRWNYWIPSRL